MSQMQKIKNEEVSKGKIMFIVVMYSLLLLVKNLNVSFLTQHQFRVVSSLDISIFLLFRERVGNG